MKNIIGHVVRLSLAALLSVACIQEKPVESVRVSDSTIILEDGELSYQFEVVANSTWSLACCNDDGSAADWFSVTPSSGNGTVKVTLNILKDNDKLTNRTGKVVVTGGNVTSEAKVTQRGVASITSFVDPQVIAISSSAATSARFSVVMSTSGATVDASLASSTPWISNLKLIQGESSDATRKTWSFDVTANTLSDSRTAEFEVVVSAKGKKNSYSVKVEQGGMGAPAIKTAEVVYLQSGETTHSQPFWVDGPSDNLMISCTCTSVTEDNPEGWLKEAKVVGNNLVITMEPNLSTDSREGSIYIVGTRGASSGSGVSSSTTVKVYQAGHSSPGVKMPASEVSVGYGANTHYVSYEMVNGSKVSKSPEANVSWIHDISASDEGVLTFKVDEYLVKADKSEYREGQISFEVNNGSKYSALVLLKVRQYVPEFSDIILPTEVTLPGKWAIELIPYDDNGGSLEVIGSVTTENWLYAQCYENEGSKALLVYGENWENAPESDVRSGVVTLKYTKNKVSVYYYINVRQNAPAFQDITVPSVINLNYDDTETTFNIVLGEGEIGNITFSSSGEWIKKVNVSRASDNVASITVIVDKWTESVSENSSRNGMVCIPYIVDGRTLFHYVQINQKSQPFSGIFVPSQLVVNQKTTTYNKKWLTFYLDATKGQIGGISSNQSWLKTSYITNTQGVCTVTIDADELGDSDEDRSCVLSVPYTMNGVSVTYYINVTQFSKKNSVWSYPDVISMAYNQTSEEFNPIQSVTGATSTIRNPNFTSEGGWLKDFKMVGGGGMPNTRMILTAQEWGSYSDTAPFRMGQVAFAITHEPDPMPIICIPVYQFSPKIVGIDIPKNVDLGAADVHREITLSGKSSATITYDPPVYEPAGGWLTVTSVTPQKIVIDAEPAYMPSLPGQTERSATVRFHYMDGGISSEYSMLVRQKIVDTPVGAIVEMPVCYRHYKWWENDDASRRQVYLSSFKWLDKSASAQKTSVKMYVIGVAKSQFEQYSQNARCENPDLFKVKVTGVNDCSSYLEVDLELSNPNFSSLESGRTYNMLFGVAEGQDLVVPVKIVAYDHFPNKPYAFNDVVPDVVKYSDKHTIGPVDLSTLSYLPGETANRFANITVGGLYENKELTTPKSSSCISNFTVTSVSAGMNIDFKFPESHKHEEGYIKLVLHTENGLTEELPIPYRLYSGVKLKSNTAVELNKRILSPAALFDNLDDWQISGANTSQMVGGSGYSLRLKNGNIIASWSKIPTSTVECLYFELKNEADRNKMSGYLKRDVRTAAVSYYPDLPGFFSVASGRVVRFTSGCLKAVYSDSSLWRIQITTQERDPLGNGGNNYTPWTRKDGAELDLFGFSSGTSYSSNDNYYGIPGDDTIYAYSGSPQDWGRLFSDVYSTYRVLTAAEWGYLFNRKVTVKVDGNTLSGQIPAYRIAYKMQRYIVMLPDEFVWNSDSMGCTYDKRIDHDISTSEMAAMEAAGAVFLPFVAGIMESAHYVSVSVRYGYSGGWAFHTLESSSTASRGQTSIVRLSDIKDGSISIRTSSMSKTTRTPVRLVKVQ